MSERVIIRASTLTEQVYEVLKERITSGAYPGGHHLVERSLAKEFGVSKTPVREALARLEREGLVLFEAGRGMRVRMLDPVEVDELLELRELLEGFIAEKAAIVGEDDDIRRLESIVTESEALPPSNIQDYKRLDEQFHRILREMARNRVLANVIDSLQAQISLVMATTIILPGRRAASVQEHRDIFEAIQAKDPRAAGEYARLHMRNARRALKQSWGAQPAPDSQG